jgi:diaphanous 1
LNQPGFRQVLASPTIITHIAYSLHGASLKLRTLASEVLAAIAVLSLDEGHRAVLAAISDYRVTYDESFRFEELLEFLRPSEAGADGDANGDISVEQDGTWEARTATMALVNALTTCADSLEERIMLREELGRRGLNEIIVVSRLELLDTMNASLPRSRRFDMFNLQILC